MPFSAPFQNMSPTVLDRYKCRHDAVLLILTNWIGTFLVPGAKLFVDVVGYESPSVLFKNFRTDIVVVLKNSLFIL